MALFLLLLSVINKDPSGTHCFLLLHNYYVILMFCNIFFSNNCNDFMALKPQACLIIICWHAPAEHSIIFILVNEFRSSQCIDPNPSRFCDKLTKVVQKTPLTRLVLSAVLLVPNNFSVIHDKHEYYNSCRIGMEKKLNLNRNKALKA